MSVVDPRTLWTAELAKEQAMVSDQLRELRLIKLALDDTAAGSLCSTENSHRLNMQEYLRRQKKQLKRRAKELEKSRQLWRVGTGTVSKATDLPQPYPEASTSESGLANTLHGMIQLQNAEHNDQIRSLTQVMQQLGRRTPRGHRNSSANRREDGHRPRSGARPQRSAPEAGTSYASPPAVESRASSAPCYHFASGPQAPTCYQPTGPTWGGGLASVCAPAYADRRPRDSAPPARLRRFASAGQWEHTQTLQQQLICDQAEWLHGFRERLRYAAGPPLAAAVPAGMPGIALPRRAAPVVPTDKATISIDGKTQIEIRIVRR